MRELNDKDIALLKKLAPELQDLICEHTQVPFRSLLPPLSNHFAKDVEDFERRLRNLDDDELAYLVNMILDGSESLACVPPDYAEVFIALVAEKISKEVAEQIITAYLDMECF